ncbi:MAG TPA: CHAT domain-containing tetratricopeptide repeat protein [Pyrinomonadaceae bacterium]|jgi:CHAT domain-containing protein/tetratricopeptide (TPR) repeat protein
MDRTELAARLVAAADTAEREALLRQNSALADCSLAYALKDICIDGFISNPASATGAARSLKLLAHLNPDAEITALAAWGAGFEALINGQIERALSHLDDARSRFLSQEKPHQAAATQVLKLYALALLGRYDEAIECGLGARQVLDAYQDQVAAGVIEQNIGNIYIRRDSYERGEQFLRAARERFAALGDQKRLAQIDNNLALTHTLQHKFRSAERLYDEALRRAEVSGLAVTQAEIEASMGNLALFQGHYTSALDLLERSRRRYAALGMPHQSAVAEQEIADAYLELNLAPEAAEIYERVTETFAGLGMQGERARALAQHGRAKILLGHTRQAHALLAEARKLYAAEGNRVGEAMVTLTEAQLHHAEGSYAKARRAARRAEAPLAEANTWRHLLMARWLRGECARAAGNLRQARTLLRATLRDAESQAQPQVAQRCYTSLGLIARAEGDAASAEAYLKEAIALIEELRAPLPAEGFRTAFFSDKLTPYDEMVRLCLEAGPSQGTREREALGFVERARSRALVDALAGAPESLPQPRDSFEAELMARLEELREELNWFYSRINRPWQGEPGRSATDMLALHEAVREREARTLEITRQLQQRRGEAGVFLSRVESLDIDRLQNHLGPHTALVEYTSLDGELLAFILTDERLEAVRHLPSEEEVGAALEQFRFQIETLRHGAQALRKYLPELALRARRHLETLYDLLLRPIEERLGGRRLAVVPHRALHYVPFHALHDGKGYVIERREVSYAPSAIVLTHCLDRSEHQFDSALLLGVADEQTPRIRDEIGLLAPLFSESVSLLDEAATIRALREHAGGADVLHLACHGQFRPENPLFSSLRLADGWLTVGDAYSLALRRCGLVTLSACETGVSAVAPGDELTGLARGFFSAGAPSLLLSLWTVDDEATARLMARFYERLRAGARPSTALRQAQLGLFEEQPHPFFWSPFVLVGRW